MLIRPHSTYKKETQGQVLPFAFRYFNYKTRPMFCPAGQLQNSCSILQIPSLVFAPMGPAINQLFKFIPDEFMIQAKLVRLRSIPG